MISKVTQHIKNRAIDKERIKNQQDFLISNYGVQTNIDILRKFIPYARLFDLLKIKTDSILDLGCGFGTLTRCLSLISNETEALDHFEEALNFARENNNFLTNIKYTCADIYEYQLEKNKYDLVFASEFHPLTRNYYKNNEEKEKYHEEIMTNIYHSLKSGGHFIISHAPVTKQTIKIKQHTSSKFNIRIYELDERVIYLFDSFFRMFKSKKLYFSVIKLFTLIRKLLFQLNITKGYKPIYILQKK